jgi:hypothetical protein
MGRLKTWIGLALAGAALLGLAGCASTYRVESRVQTFTSLPALPAPATFRFERLPSQQADPAQAQLETLADPALSKAGFRRDDAAPRYSVQVSARSQRVLSPWADPWDWGWGGGWGVGFGRRFHRGGIGFGLSSWDQPWFEREVAVIVRDLPSQKVVFESRAAGDGPLRDSGPVLTAMFEAALQGFPNVPQGVRRVEVPLPQ